MRRAGEVKFPPERVASVGINGTDTVCQPKGNVSKFYKNGEGSSETISFVASCIEPSYNPDLRYLGFDELVTHCSELRLHTDIKEDVIDDPYYGPQIKKNKLKFARDIDDPQIRLIEGPETTAVNVYQKIAKGVVTIIGSVINGKNIINLFGHSRGAVIAVEIPHELHRIKEAMYAYRTESDSNTLILLICGNPHDNKIDKGEAAIRRELRTIFKKLESNLSKEELNRFVVTIRDSFAIRDGYHPNCREVWVECLIQVDPVSGNSVLGLPFIGWVTPRMFKYSPIIRNVYTLMCANEDTACFDLTYTIAECDYTNVERFLLPGHHGTVTGNEFGNNGETLEDIRRDRAMITEPDKVAEYEGLHTRDAQYMALYLIVEHLRAHGTEFTISARHDYPLSEKYNPYMQALLAADNGKSKERIQYAAYQDIMRNLKAYKLLNHTTYIYTGWDWHESMDSPYHETTKTRPVMLDEQYHKTSLGELVTFRSQLFYNWHHLKLFMKIVLPFDPSIEPEKQLANLLRFSEDLQHKLDDEHSVIEEVQDAIQTIVLSLVSTYITNNLTADRKQEIIRLINQTLQITIPKDEIHYATNYEEAVATSMDSVVEIDYQGLTNLGLLKQRLITDLHDRIYQQVDEKVQEQTSNLKKLIADIRKARNPEAEKKRIADKIASHDSTDGHEEKVEDNSDAEAELQRLRDEGEHDLIKAMLENNLPYLIGRYFEILKFTKHLKDLRNGLTDPGFDDQGIEHKVEDLEENEQAQRIGRLKAFIEEKSNALNTFAIDEIGTNIKNEIINFVKYNRDILEHLVYEIRLTAEWQPNADEADEVFQARKTQALKNIINNISKKHCELRASIDILRQYRNNPEYTASLTAEQVEEITSLKAYLKEEVQNLDNQVTALPLTVAYAIAETSQVTLLKQLEYKEGPDEFCQSVMDACEYRAGGIRSLEKANARLQITTQVAINIKQTEFNPSYSFHILNGFILALGIAAVAIAIAILISQPLTAAAAPAAIIGVAGLCATGLGLYQNRKAAIATGRLEASDNIVASLQS